MKSKIVDRVQLIVFALFLVVTFCLWMHIATSVEIENQTPPTKEISKNVQNDDSDVGIGIGPGGIGVKIAPGIQIDSDGNMGISY